MCGLVGLVNKKTNGFTAVQNDMFTTLLYLDALRGMDSTGVFTITNTGDLHMAKDVGSSLRFMGSQEYKDLKSLAFSKGSAMIGHNRKATKGVVNDINAHPFIVDDKICLIHNGTLWSHRHHADVEVDSHAIAHLIAKEDDLNSVINKINGAYALIWYDFEQDTLNFLRNDERPLYWAETANEYIWCSEKEMIEFVCAREKIKITDGPNELPEHTLTTFSLENSNWSVDTEKLKLEKKVYQSSSANHNRYANAYEDMEDGCGAGWQFGQWHQDRFPQGQSPSYNCNPARVSSKIHDKDADRAALLRYGNGVTATTQKEHELGIKNCSLVAPSELTPIFTEYPAGSTLIAEAFDYTEVNEADGKAGYFIWLCPVNDPNVIVRHRYEPDSISESELVNLIIHKPFFRVTLGARAWHKVENISKGKEGVGWLLFNADKVEMVAQQKLEVVSVH